jgi:hypothetical protein
MNTTITTTIPVEICTKIKENRWAYNELILLGIKCLEEEHESQIQLLEEGNKRIQDKLTDLSERTIE